MLTNLSSLISKSLDFVNLGKFLSDAGPGFVLTVAVSLLVSTVAQLPILPIAIHTAELRGQPCNEDGTVDFTFPTQGRLEEKLVSLKRGICQAQVSVWKSEKAKATADAKFTQLEASRDAFLAAWEILDKEKTERDSNDNYSTPGLKSSAGNKKEAYEAAQKLVDAEIESQVSNTIELGENVARFEALQGEFDRLLGLRVSTLSTFINYLFDHLLFLGFTGWLVGTMMAPLNRTLMTGFTESARDRIRKEAKCKISKITDSIFASSRLTGEELSEEDRKEITEFVSDRRAAFFIGRKIITKPEWDDLVTTYYRWAELSSNLVVPFSVLGLALGAIAVRAPELNLRTVPWMPLAALVSLAVAVLAFQRSKSALRTYHTRQAEFIAGRLIHVLEQKNKVNTLVAAAQKAEKALGAVNKALLPIKAEKPVPWQKVLFTWLEENGWVRHEES